MRAMDNRLSAQHALPHLNGDRFARSCEPLSKRQRMVRNISVCVLAVSALLLVGCGAGLPTTPNADSPNGSQPGSPSPSPTPNPDPSPTPSPSAQCNGTGLAAADVAGQCRTSPTTMGALEVGGGSGATFASFGSAQTASGSLQVSWQPLGSSASGYMVYFGKSSATANVFLSDLPANSGLYSPNAPTVTYNASRDLGLYAGDSACFRIFAYDTAHALSSQSTLVCTVV